MQQQTSSTDSERDSLRALIDQKTKEWEASNGKVETLDIVRRELTSDYWDKSKASPSKIDEAAQNKEVAERYPEAECLPSLAKELGMSTSALANKASKLEVKRVRKKKKPPQDIKASHAPTGKDEAHSKKLDLPARSTCYYFKKLAAINKEADAIERKINSIARIGSKA